ncbi:MAG TPA: hypothetical protein VKG24_02960 [Pseudolabrys sp.]|nr:hypothetical protein [Pseudolabrys sp.]
MPFPKFTATAEQRRFVIALAGSRLGHEQIRSVVRNPATDRPLSRATFARVFRNELATAKTRMQSVVISKYYEALARGDAWAIQWGLRHYCGFRDDNISVAVGNAPSAEDTGIVVSFVRPTRWLEDQRAENQPKIIDHSQFNGGKNGS